jgi:Flp pilus assembly pilin Flp
MRQGLVEYAFLSAFLALAVAGALAIFGDEIRGALGLRGAPVSAAAAPAPPPAATP